MGKKTLRIIPVPKGVTFALLVLASIAVVWAIYWLSGKAYLKDRPAFEEIEIVYRHIRGIEPQTNATLIAVMMPVVANVMLLVPWGFLAFLVMDRPGWSRARTYLVTLIAAALFSLVLVAWQGMLPTRITGIDDSMWNVVGAMLGAMVAHARKRIQIRFE
jgi:glycopeptide antibiotics resistance protein